MYCVVDVFWLGGWVGLLVLGVFGMGVGFLVLVGLVVDSLVVGCLIVGCWCVVFYIFFVCKYGGRWLVCLVFLYCNLV